MAVLNRETDLEAGTAARSRSPSSDEGATDVSQPDAASMGLVPGPYPVNARPLSTNGRAAQMASIQAIHGNQFAQRFVQRAISNASSDRRFSQQEVADRLNSSDVGQPLEPGVRGRLEAGLGADLRSVRVHTDGQADQMARSVDALAFTTGDDIFFQAGTYSPGSEAGDRLIAHEVVHTIQQSAVDVGTSPTASLHRQENPDGGTPGGPGDDQQDTTAKLRAILGSVQNLYAQARGALNGAEADGEAGSTPVSDHCAAVESAIAQIQSAISTEDESLRASILAAFTPQSIASATNQAGTAIQVETRAQGAASERVSLPTVVQRRTQSIAMRSLHISQPQDPAEVEAEEIATQLVSGGHSPDALPVSGSDPSIQRMAAIAAPLIAFEMGGGAEAEAAAGPAGWAVGAVIGLVILVSLAVPSDESTVDESTAMERVQGDRASGQLTNIARHLARLLALGGVGGVPSGEPPKNNNDDDNHWWSEIKGSIQQFLQAVKGASRKQIIRELLKRGWTEDEIAEIVDKLKEAGRLMGEDPPDLLPPP